MAPIETIVETGVYASDLAAAEAFYHDVLGLEAFGREAGRHVFFRVGTSSMLLIFQADATLRGDVLPAHGREGRDISLLACATKRWRRGRSG